MEEMDRCLRRCVVFALVLFCCIFVVMAFVFTARAKVDVHHDRCGWCRFLFPLARSRVRSRTQRPQFDEEQGLTVGEMSAHGRVWVAAVTLANDGRKAGWMGYGFARFKICSS